MVESLSVFSAAYLTVERLLSTLPQWHKFMHFYVCVKALWQIEKKLCASMSEFIKCENSIHAFAWCLKWG
jgi:hypothetical protein